METDLFNNNYNNNILKGIKVNAGQRTRKVGNNYIYNKNQKILNMEFNNYYSEDNNLRKIMFIQKWWKYLYKIIFIQKCIRGFLSRKSLINLLYFIKCSIKLLFKLVINNIRQKINLKKNKRRNSNINNNSNKKNNINNNQNSKNKENTKNNRNIKYNNIIGINSNNSYYNKKMDNMKKIENKKIKMDTTKRNNNNNVNMSKSNNRNNSNNGLTNKCFNKNKKLIKDKKEKEKEKSSIMNEEKLIAYNNIFNIYNNVKKYYETENNNNICNGNYSSSNNFYKKNKKSPFGKNNNDISNKKIKARKMVTKRSLKNINEKTILNKNSNISLNVNINNNPKSDNRFNNSENKEAESIKYLLKLKKVFIYWKELLIRKKIIKKLKNLKSIKTPNNMKKTSSKFSDKNIQSQRPVSITTKKINLSNSSNNLNLNECNKSNLQNNNLQLNSVLNSFGKGSHIHSNSVENNNSMIALNQHDFKRNEDKKENIKNNCLTNDICNNNIIVINQYDRNKKFKKKKEDKNNHTNNDVNNNDKKMKEKIYYFYAVINLIDKHNKRKRIKKLFNLWKSSLRYSRTFINSNGIEEKIISFKSLKSPHKKTGNESKINKKSNLILAQNKSFDNYNYQTEATDMGGDINFGHTKINSVLNQRDLLTPNPIEKTGHPKLYKSNLNQTKIVYQKKFLAPKKVKNESIFSMNFNDIEEDKNMTLIDNNTNYNILSQSSGNTFYNKNNNDLSNSINIRRNNLENSIRKIQEGRLNNVPGIEQNGINFSPEQIHTQKNNFRLQKKNLYRDYYNNNVNVVENYRKMDIDKECIEDNKDNFEKNKNRITTKQIILGEKKKRFKNSHSQEFRNDNQML